MILGALLVPTELRQRGWRHGEDPLFLLIFAVSLLFHFATAACIALTPAPPTLEPADFVVTPRETRAHLPRPPNPLPPPGTKRSPAAQGTLVAMPDTVDPREAGLNRLLSRGNAGKALEDVLGEAATSQDIGRALSGAKHLVFESNASPHTRPSSDTSGHVEGIGPVSTAGAAHVEMGERVERGSPASKPVSGLPRSGNPFPWEGLGIPPAPFSGLDGRFSLRVRPRALSVTTGPLSVPARRARNRAQTRRA
jgi:hypothetical protein